MFNALFQGDTNPGKYIKKIEPTYHEYYDPYVESGRRANATLEEQFNKLLSDPAALYKHFAQGFEESPGYEFGMKNALRGSDQAAAAGGYLGTPGHEEQSARLAQDLSSDEFNKFMQQILGLYGQGLQGESGINERGYGASTGLAGNLSSLYGSQAENAANNANAKDKAWSTLIASILGGAAGGAGAIPGVAGGAGGAAFGASAGMGNKFGANTDWRS